MYMGHSVAQQRDTYDRRTVQQKVEPAVEMLNVFNTQALAQQGQAQQGAVAPA